MKLTGERFDKFAVFIMEQLKDAKIPADTKVHSVEIKTEIATVKWSCWGCKKTAAFRKERAFVLVELESENGYCFDNGNDDASIPKNIWLGYGMNFCSLQCCEKFIAEL